MHEQKRNADDCEGCGDCALSPDRRAFIKVAGLAALAALLDVGMPPGLAAAMHPTAIASLRMIGGNPSYPIPATDGVQIDKKNEVIMVRWKDEVIAFNLSCPHQNTALHWSEGDKEFQCPKHHSKYKPDGTFISGRATRNMDRFSLIRQADQVVVNVASMHKNDIDPRGWSASVLLVSKGA